MRTRLLRIAAPLVLCLGLTACGPHESTQLGLRSTALDLQFARPDLAVPVPPNIVIQLLPAPAPFLQHLIFKNYPVPPITPPTPTPGCPPPGTPGSPGKPLVTGTTKSPNAGYYFYDTKGTGTVSGGKTSYNAPIVGSTQVAISRGQQTPPDTTVAAEGGAPASGTETLYTVTTLLAPNVRQIDTLEVSATSINLVKRQLTNGQRTFDFSPSPQVQLMVFGAPGSSWSSKGVDSATSSTLDYSGTIEGTTKVTACGITTDAYHVTYSSTLTDPAGSEIIRTGTDSSHPASFVIAPQLGGLILQQQVYSDDERLDTNLGGFVSTVLNYTSTISDTAPQTP